MLSQAFVATDTGVLPYRVSEPKIGKSQKGFYLFAVSAVISVVWIDSYPWRYGEQHFSRLYVRSGEYSPGCQLTSAAREVELGISESDASPAAGSLLVVLLEHDMCSRLCECWFLHLNA